MGVSEKTNSGSSKGTKLLIKLSAINFKLHVECSEFSMPIVIKPNHAT